MALSSTDHGRRTTDQPRRLRGAFLAIAGLTLPFFPSCSSPSHAPTTQVALDNDVTHAQADYWFDKPAVVSVSDPNFYRLWNACQSEVRLRLFLIDRQDYREGMLTTQPLISKQFFEVWRRDVVTADELAKSSIETMRRTVHVQITRQRDGSFRAQPKVLVERYASAERRITDITEYTSAFTSPRPVGETDVGAPTAPPPEYWYAVGRDEALERDLAKSIQNRLRG